MPTAALMYRPIDTVMTYASYSRGIEKGEYAPFSAANPMQPTAAIESEQVEVGLKADIMAGLNLGVAAFDIRRDASYLNAANVFVSDGRYRHRGVEVSATGRLAPGLNVLANVAWLDARLQQVSDPTTLGKRSEGVPRWKGTLGARYAVAVVPGLSLDTVVNAVSRRPVDAQNSGFIPGYATWDAGIGYDVTIARVPTTFRLHGKNLTDRYHYPGVSFGGLDVGRGREVFLSAG